MPDDIPLRQQLTCAARELALRARVYPRLIANETMRASTARRELAATRAIARALKRLLAEDEGAEGQAELFGARDAREAQP